MKEKTAEKAFMMSIICRGERLLLIWKSLVCHCPVNESKNRKRSRRTTPHHAPLTLPGSPNTFCFRSICSEESKNKYKLQIYIENVNMGDE